MIFFQVSQNNLFIVSIKVSQVSLSLGLKAVFFSIPAISIPIYVYVYVLICAFI